jgi:hypothetical protein
MKKTNKVNPLTYFNNNKAAAVKKAGKEMSTYKKSLKKAQTGGGLYGTPTLQERGIKNVYQGPLNEEDSKYMDKKYPLTTKDSWNGPFLSEDSGSKNMSGRGYYNPDPNAKGYTKLQKQQAARERLENLARSNDQFVQKRNKEYGNLTGKDGTVKSEGKNINWNDQDIDINQAMRNSENAVVNKDTGAGMKLYKRGGSNKRKRK